MRPILYESDETEFLTNGIGTLDPVSCLVTEERNGQFEVEMDIPIDDLHFPDIREGRILYVPYDETGKKQPFDIYKISRPMNGMVTVNAHHVSYRTAKMTIGPFTASSCAGAVSILPDKVVGGCPFEFWTDKEVNGHFAVKYPKTVRSLLGGEEGSILDTYGTGEYEWDHFTIKLHLHRGRDTGVVLRYGKNLLDVKKTTDSTNVWTGVVPYWLGSEERQTDDEDDASPPDEEDVLVMLEEKVLYSPYRDLIGGDYVIPLDLSNAFQDKPTEEQLRNKALKYIEDNAKAEIPASIDVSFIALWQTEEYKSVAPLQRLRLCDSLTVEAERFGISNTAKIVKTVYDVLLERYDSMTIGDVRTGLGDTIRAETDDLKREIIPQLASKSEMQKAIDHATMLIQGGKGGYVVMGTDADGKPDEILILDEPNIEDAVNVLRINKNGIGFSSTGYNGEYRSAWTLDGRFVADFITAGKLTANVIKAGIIKGMNGDSYWDMESGVLYLAATAEIAGEKAGTIKTAVMTTAEGLSAEVTRAQNTEAALSNRLSVSENGISAEVTRAKNAEGALSSRIAVTEQGIQSVVTKGNVCSIISQSSDEVSIKSNRFSLESTNCEISKDGKIKAKDAELTGKLVTNSDDVYGVLTIVNGHIIWGDAQAGSHRQVIISFGVHSGDRSGMGVGNLGTNDVTCNSIHLNRNDLYGDPVIYVYNNNTKKYDEAYSGSFYTGQKLLTFRNGLLVSAS